MRHHGELRRPRHPRHPTTIGDHVLIGPHAYVSGATVADEVFLATGSMVFNGARMGQASSVALGGAVHIGCQVAAGTRVPIGWVAVGDPAELYRRTKSTPSGRGSRARAASPLRLRHERRPDPPEAMRAAMTRYTRGLASHHEDRTIDG